jgi:signal transduction histidine kinase
MTWGFDQPEPERERLGALCPRLPARSVALAAAIGTALSATPATAADASLNSASTPSTFALVFGIGFVVLCLAVGGVLLRRLRQMETEVGELRVRQAHAATLARVLDVWQWRTDARHRLLAIEAPMGCAKSTTHSAAGNLDNLWVHFAGIDPDTGGLCPTRHAALRQRIEAQQAAEDVWVSRRSANDSVQVGVLRALPVHDATGAFIGHVGTWRECTLTAAPATSPRSAAVLPSATVTDADAARPAPMPSLTPLAIPTENDADSFSYTVSHDLRAPIRVVEGFTKIVKEDYGRLLDRVGNDHLDRVLGAAARMNSMIDALLALSQLSAKPVSRQPVNLSQLAGFVIDDLRRQSPQHTVTVHIDPTMQVQGDPTLLRVVLENLLGNAWKYTGKCADPQVWFERCTDTATPSFTVRDNGAGFDMRFADRLFGVFQRLHSASEFQGTGVGLASVRRIVHKHGGEVWAESAVGQGASFHFSLAPLSN